jgi:hypothetical protein
LEITPRHQLVRRHSRAERVMNCELDAPFLSRSFNGLVKLTVELKMNFESDEIEACVGVLSGQVQVVPSYSS